MKKDYLHKLIIFSICLLFSSCIKDEYTISPTGNFEALWKIIDENYCFFEYKDIDWKQVYDQYSREIYENMDDWDLFYTLSNMVNELEDGHVNLFNNVTFSSYDSWYSDDPFVFSLYTVLNNYLDGNYSFFNETVYYKALAEENIGYIYYKTFTESVLETELNQMFEKLQNCSAIIIDVRDNSGGSLTNSDRLASRFFHKKQLTGYIQHKTGKGHTDFSDPYPIYLEPSHAVLWPEEKPVVILTNRRCYSATNNFVSKMKVLRNVTTIGVRTGGGSGFPFTSELPNGWGIRFSTSPILDINKQHTEFGIEPDITTQQPQSSQQSREADHILERAIQYLTTGK